MADNNKVPVYLCDELVLKIEKPQYEPDMYLEVGHVFINFKNYRSNAIFGVDIDNRLHLISLYDRIVGRNDKIYLKEESGIFYPLQFFIHVKNGLAADKNDISELPAVFNEYITPQLRSKRNYYDNNNTTPVVYVYRDAEGIDDAVNTLCDNSSIIEKILKNHQIEINFLKNEIASLKRELDKMY